MRSRLAEWTPAKRKRTKKMRTVFGAVYHTTGRGVLKQARKRGITPEEWALRWYRGLTRSGVHYLIGQDGTIYQMLEDDIRGAHVGISGRERRLMLSGKWSTKVPTVPAMLWFEKYGKHFKSPQHLYPTKSPNDCYIGVEWIPQPDATFTLEQYRTGRDLWLDLSYRHGWCARQPHPGRLVGHEDIDPFARWQTSGGWDPGALRERPRFDWNRIHGTPEGVVL